jgi:hypothetical protein
VIDPTRTLFGLLFPSWTFFDTVRLTPTLEVRRLPIDGTAGDWRAAIVPEQRRWWNVVFNPAGTRILAAQTVVETWFREVIDADARDTAHCPSFPLVRALAGRSLAVAPLRPGDRWALRLVVRHEADGQVDVVCEHDGLVVLSEGGPP